MEIITQVLVKNQLVFAFLVIGAVMYVSYRLSDVLTKGRLHGSAVAIILGAGAGLYRRHHQRRRQGAV